MEAVNAVPVVGQPIAYGVGFIAVLLVGLTGPWAASFVTVAHEGGHMAMSVLTLRGFRGFKIEPNSDGATSGVRSEWGVGWILTVFAGYATPPLLGLGAAAVVASGNPWAVLVGTAVLLLAAFFLAETALTIAFALVVLAGVVATALFGGPVLQAAVAVGVVWVLLLGSLLATFRLSRGKDTDPDFLFRATLVPRIVWQAIWIAIAVVSLYVGGRLLLSGS